MSKADDLRDRIWYASLNLEAWRAKYELGGRAYPEDTAAALATIEAARDELHQMQRPETAVDGAINHE